MSSAICSMQPQAARTPLLIRASGASVQGSRRDNNEDLFYIDPHHRFFVIADGIGGNSAGEIAASLAIQFISQQLGRLDRQPAELTAALLRRCIVEANGLVAVYRGDDVRLRHMGTTVGVAAIVQQRLYATGVGDSRIYLIRGGDARQLTVDDSVAQALLEAGILSSEQFRFHPYRSVLHKFLGCEELGDGPRVSQFELQAGDSLLLATDGLTDVVDAELLAAVIANESTPQAACDALVRLAVERGSADDITCVVLFVDPLHFEGDE